MGISNEEYPEFLKKLQPTIHSTQPDKPDTITEDPTFGNEDLIRGIPLVGRVSGTMRGTRPGDAVRGLEDAGTEILRSMLKKSRGR